MVAEPITETQAADASAGDQVATITTTGDAANQTIDAAIETKQDEAEESVNAFLGKSKEDGEASKEAVQDGGEEVDPLIKDAADKAAAAAAEKAEREANDRIEREKRQRDADAKAAEQAASFRKGYTDRIDWAGNGLEQELLAAGMSPVEAARIAAKNRETFNSHHADGLKLYEEGANAQAKQAVFGEVNSTLEEVLGSDAPKFFRPDGQPKQYDIKGHYEALKAIWTEGMKTKAEAEAETSLALVNYHRELQKTGKLKPSSSGQDTSGSYAGRSLSIEEIDAMPTSEWQAVPKAERERLLVEARR